MEGREENCGPSTPSASRWKEDCAKLASMLNNLEDSLPYREPVDLDECPDYFDVVDTPMDLMTVRDNLEWEVYNSPEEFAEDMETIFTNALAYNIYKRCKACPKARRLSAVYETRMRRILRNHEAAMRHSEQRETHREKENEYQEDDLEPSRNKHQETSPTRCNLTQTGISTTRDEGAILGSCTRESSNRRPVRRNSRSDETSPAVAIPRTRGSGFRNQRSEPTILTTRSGRNVKLIAGGFREIDDDCLDQGYPRPTRAVLSERIDNKSIG